MATLPRSEEAVVLRRAIEDALWSLDHGYPIGAVATLRHAMRQMAERDSRNAAAGR